MRDDLKNLYNREQDILFFQFHILEVVPCYLNVFQHFNKKLQTSAILFPGVYGKGGGVGWG